MLTKLALFMMTKLIVNQARHGALNKAAWKGHSATVEWLLYAPEGTVTPLKYCNPSQVL